ncbi:hypothetical protein MRX96_025525 [Rhipicephalus microplus]
MGSDEDTPVADGTFVNLNCVDMYVTLLKAVFRSLLCVTRGTLRIARFVDEGTCTAFLEYCARLRPGVYPFVNLERLTLATNKPLRTLALEPRDLHHVAMSLAETATPGDAQLRPATVLRELRHSQ